MHRILRAAAALTAAGGLLALAGPASASDHGAAGHRITVVGNGSSVRIDHTTVHAGTISFKVSSTNPASQNGGGSTISLFRPKQGVTLAQVFADLREELSSTPAVAAKGSRDIVRDVSLYGLADVIPGYPEIVTENLRHGTYYLMDLANYSGKGQPKTTRLVVTGHAEARALYGRVHVAATSTDRFIAPASWPHHATYLFRNVSDTIHFMAIVPVKDGTTDQQIQAYFSSGSQSPPPFARNGPSGGNDVVSPGKTIAVSYNLPRGTYALLCFVADDVTGMPHAVMGMHKVIRLT
jgi:hypothetical protein